MLSQQPKNHTLRDCSTDVQIPWVMAPQCNCSSGEGVAAAMLDPTSPMANFPGRSKVVSAVLGQYYCSTRAGPKW
jgi:hypothetical protein